jgi:hypothetical protein
MAGSPRVLARVTTAAAVWAALASAFAVTSVQAANPACPKATKTTATSCEWEKVGQHVFTVPSGVTTLMVIARGAHGVNVTAAGMTAGGGDGDVPSATFPAPPAGTKLYAEVGILGGAGDGGAGAGGGESDLRTCPPGGTGCPALGSPNDPRLIVGGGGGGAGLPFSGGGNISAGGGGGAGGGAHGGPGDCSGTGVKGTGGNGGAGLGMNGRKGQQCDSAALGGLGGPGSPRCAGGGGGGGSERTGGMGGGCTTGTAGNGGNAATGSDSGGGGAGYFGGAAGSGGGSGGSGFSGGGGGSSFIAPSGSNVAFTRGQAGVPFVKISWTVTSPVVPEVPSVLYVPLLAVAAAGTAFALVRRRLDRSAS